MKRSSGRGDTLSEARACYLKVGKDYRHETNDIYSKRIKTTDSIRFESNNHIIGKLEKQRRCQLDGCKGKPKTYCIKCNVTLCTKCFGIYHGYAV